MFRDCELQPCVLPRTSNDRAAFERVRELYHRSREVDDAVARAEQLEFDNLRDAIQDLIAEHGDKYPDGPKYLEQLARVEYELTVATAKYRDCPDRREPHKRRRTPASTSEFLTCWQSMTRCIFGFDVKPVDQLGAIAPGPSEATRRSAPRDGAWLRCLRVFGISAAEFQMQSGN